MRFARSLTLFAPTLSSAARPWAFLLSARPPPPGRRRGAGSRRRTTTGTGARTNARINIHGDHPPSPADRRTQSAFDRADDDEEQRRVLETLYRATNGEGWHDEGWTRNFTLGWMDDAVSYCAWGGVSCCNTTLYNTTTDAPPDPLPPRWNCTAHDILGLNLYGINLEGSIPSEIGTLVDLDHLILGANELTGTIPPEIGALVKLQVLAVAENQLTGTIPSEIGILVELERLSLGHNNLTETIPSEMGSLVKMDHLYLDHNQLTGSIPSEMDSLVELSVLDLNSNQLTGTLPPRLCVRFQTDVWGENTRLDMDENKFDEGEGVCIVEEEVVEVANRSASLGVDFPALVWLALLIGAVLL